MFGLGPYSKLKIAQLKLELINKKLHEQGWGWGHELSGAQSTRLLFVNNLKLIAMNVL